MHLPALRLTALFLSGLLAITARADVTEKISQTHPLAADGSVVVENVNGSIEITGWDRPEVSLEAEKKGKTEEDLQRISVVIDARADRFAVKTVHEKIAGLIPRSNHGSVTYRLKVPTGARLEKIDTVNSRITVRGVTGHVNLDTVNGSIEASGLAAGGRFDTVNGSVDVSFDRVRAGDQIVLDSVNGSCRVSLPKDAAFALVADSVNGSIRCDFPITIEKSGRRHLRGKVGDGSASLKLDSVNGGLRINAH